MDMTGCVIIKKKELDELYKRIDNLKKDYSRKIDNLEGELSEEKAKK